MAEGAPLLRAYGRNSIEGSNPSLSAINNKASSKDGAFLFIDAAWMRTRQRVRQNTPMADFGRRRRPEGVKTALRLYESIPHSPP